MRILVISNLFPPDALGGYEMGCRQVVEALRAAGHEVFVLTAQPRGRPVPFDPDVHRRLKLVDVYDYHYDWKERPVVKALRHHEACGLQSANVHALTEAVEAFRPDVAYLWNLIGLGGLGLIAAIQHVGVPWVMHLMDDVPRSLCANHREGPVVKPLAETFLKLARGRFISCSRTTVAEIAAAGVDIADRTTLVPNWVTATGPLRDDYLPGGKLRVISAGALTNAKGVHITIQAAAELRRMGVENFAIDIYGPGVDPEFPNLIQRLGVGDAVRLMGARTQRELYDLYPRYDVFAFPTWAREPMAFAPLEAMAFGCLAVFTPANGNAEWFVDGLDCLKADRDPVAFAVALARVARGEVDVAAIGRRAARLMHREFRLEKLVTRIEGVLRAAAAAGGGPARPAAEAYHVALLAEKTFQCLINEAAA